jgi:lipoprotein-releasing system permease protein
MFTVKTHLCEGTKNHSALNFAGFISSRITFKSKRTFSKLIVRIAIIGIMLGLGVMILSLAVIKGFKQEIREKVRGFAGDIQIVKADNNVSYEKAALLTVPMWLRTLSRLSWLMAFTRMLPSPVLSKPIMR